MKFDLQFSRCVINPKPKETVPKKEDKEKGKKPGKKGEKKDECTVS